MPRGLAGQEHPHPSPQAILAREGKPHNWRRSPTAQKPSGHPCSTASTDAPKATPGTPGYTAVPAPSQHCRYGGQRSYDRSTISSTDAHSVAETPLHEGNPSSPHPSQIFHGRKRPQTSLRWEATQTSWWWIISRGSTTEIHYISLCHQCPQGNIWQTWGTRNIDERQRSTRCLSRVHRVCQGLWLLSHNQQPTLPPGQWLGGENSEDHQEAFKESSDQPLALLSYRTTPLPWCGLSPAELCFGRPLRTDIPRTKDSLTPRWPFLEKFRDDDESFKRRQKRDYDKRHRTHSVPELPAGTGVWINTANTEGVANPSLSAPRSYTVTTANGTVRRNRSHLNVVPDSTQTPLTAGQEPPMTGPPTQRMILTRSRTRTPVIPPDRL